MTCLLAATWISGCTHAHESVADRWAHYQPKDLDVMLGEVAAIHTAHPGIHFASGPKYMVRVTVAPVTRELPSDVLAFLTRWQQHWGVDHDMESAVTHIVLVSGRTSFTWMPIQGSLVPALKRAPVGESIDLYVMFLGILATGDSVFLINAFEEGPAQSSESESPPHNKPLHLTAAGFGQIGPLLPLRLVVGYTRGRR